MNNKIQITVIVVLMGLLFIVLSQPVWRGEQMAAEFKSDCAKRHGVLLEHHGWLATNYECASNLGGETNEHN